MKFDLQLTLNLISTYELANGFFVLSLTQFVQYALYYSFLYIVYLIILFNGFILLYWLNRVQYFLKEEKNSPCRHCWFMNQSIKKIQFVLRQFRGRKKHIACAWQCSLQCHIHTCWSGFPSTKWIQFSFRQINFQFNFILNTMK